MKYKLVLVFLGKEMATPTERVIYQNLNYAIFHLNVAEYLI